MYFCGPIRAEYWEAQRETTNLKYLMKEEGFTEDDIERVEKKVNWRTSGLMKKYIIRMRIRYTQKKWFPYIWQRWR